MGVYTTSTAVNESSIEDMLFSEAELASFNPMGFMVDTYRADQALFEALIEVDFAEIYNENGMISLTEAEQEESKEVSKKGVWQTIKEKIEYAIRWVAGKFSEMMKKISEVLDKDNRITKKFKSYMDAKNFEGCPVKGRYIDVAAYKKVREYASKQIDVKSMFYDLVDANDENIDSVVESIKSKLESYTAKDIAEVEVVKTSGEKTLIEAAGNDSINLMISIVNNGGKLEKETIKTVFSSMKKSLEEEKKVIESKFATKSDTNTKKINAASMIVTAVNKANKEISSIVMKAVKDVISASRAFYVSVGSYALNKAGGKNTDAKKKDEKIERVEGEVVDKKDVPNNEAAFNTETAEMLAEMSNMYVDDIFASVF